jgi:hypothetical protein
MGRAGRSFFFSKIFCAEEELKILLIFLGFRAINGRKEPRAEDERRCKELKHEKLAARSFKPLHSEHFPS